MSKGDGDSCLSETWKEKNLSAQPPLSFKWEWSGRWEEPGGCVSWPLTVPARAVLSLGSWEAEKWVRAAGAGSQLTAGRLSDGALPSSALISML